jgi:heptosyltransferase III
MSILFITSNPLGDAILSTGAITWLTRKFPGEKIVVAAGPVSAPLFRAMPEVEAAWPMRKAARGGHWWQLWRQAIQRHWRYVLDLRGSATAYVLRADGRKVVSVDRSLRHRVVQLSEHLNVPGYLAPRLCWREEHMEEALTRLGGTAEPLLVVGPTAKWIGKAWPSERYMQLIERLTSDEGRLPGARVVVAGAPGEESQAAPLIEALPADRVIPAIGWPLPVVAAAVSRARLYVGNDTGLMHLAAAAGAPTVGLFGPSRPEQYAPWGDKGAYVRSPVSYEELAALPRFPYGIHRSLVDGISVERVLETAEDLLNRLG